MIPLTVNAATISAEPTEMKVGDIVTVTVEVNTADAEAVQFDLVFHLDQDILVYLFLG